MTKETPEQSETNGVPRERTVIALAEQAVKDLDQVILSGSNRENVVNIQSANQEKPASPKHQDEVKDANGIPTEGKPARLKLRGSSPECAVINEVAPPPAKRPRMQETSETSFEVEGGLVTTPLELPRYNYSRDCMPNRGGILSSVLTRIISHIEEVFADESNNQPPRDPQAQPESSPAPPGCQCRSPPGPALTRILTSNPGTPIVISRIERRPRTQVDQGNHNEGEHPESSSRSDHSHGSLCWGHVADLSADQNTTAPASTTSTANPTNAHGETHIHNTIEASEPNEQIFIIIELSETDRPATPEPSPPATPVPTPENIESTDEAAGTRFSNGHPPPPASRPGAFATPPPTAAGPRVVSFLDPIQIIPTSINLPRPRQQRNSPSGEPTRRRQRRSANSRNNSRRSEPRRTRRRTSSTDSSPRHSDSSSDSSPRRQRFSSRRSPSRDTKRRKSRHHKRRR